ncbi:MAG: nitroreductase [Candidatus Azotimanducaceae bacterium]|jgi:nitroreductase
MLDVYEAMSTLRAVRRLKSDPIPTAVLNRVLQAAAWAPTGGNAQPFRIVVVKNPEYKLKIGTWYKEEWQKYIAPSRAALMNMPEVDRTSHGKTIKAGDYLAAHMQEAPVLLVFCFNPNHMAITDAKLDRASVVGGGSVYPAVQNVLLACRKEGLGCVLTTLLCFKEAEIKNLLEIPVEWGTCAHIPIGYPVLKGHGSISRRSVNKLSFLDRWDNEF